jgi:LPS O-antigen subunit length determinant protein (WzzB/FepE family)
MTPLQLQIVKKKIEEIRKQSKADLEAVCNVAKLQHDYRLTQLENALKVCEHVQKTDNVPSDA